MPSLPALASDAPPESPPGHAALVLSARFGTPLRVSAGAGVVLGSVRHDAQYRRASGWLIQGAAGVGGGQLAAGKGFALLYGPATPYLGAAFKAVAVRTWGEPLGAEPDQTYLGAEVEFALLSVHGSLGVLRRVSGEAGKATVVTWGVGIGL